MPTNNVSLKNLSLMMFLSAAAKDYHISPQLVNMQRESDYQVHDPSWYISNETSTQIGPKNIAKENRET